MHTSNHFYGHVRTLAEYVGEPNVRRPIKGVLQHGWHATTGRPGGWERSVSWLRLLCWSQRNLDASSKRVLRPIAVGAPFVYLAGDDPAPPSELRSTLCYPYHSTEWTRLTGSNQRYVRELAERESNPVTVCLYWLEYNNPEIRRCYEEADFRVICHGYRDDDLFLRRQMDELLRHDRVVSNRIGTALLYAGLLGRSIEVYGEVFELAGAPASSSLGSDFQKREFPDLTGGGLNPALANELARRELGADFVREPGELREILGWNGEPSALVDRLQSTLAHAEVYGRVALQRSIDALRR